MIHLRLPDDRVRCLTFYLSMEEYAAVNLPDSFFLWQVAPTVIFGRNQDMEAEVNTQFCTDNGVQMYRRKSGGGCVYSDQGNLMISCISSERDVESMFRRFLDSVAEVLRQMGMEAVKSENNDILVGGRKVSGNAFHVMPKAGVVHGTLLYDTDFEQLQYAITPSKEKLDSKGIKSVRQRVANLKELGLKYDLDTVKSNLINYFCDGEIILTDEQIADIEELEKGYLDVNFIRYGRATGKSDEKNLSL